MSRPRMLPVLGSIVAVAWAASSLASDASIVTSPAREQYLVMAKKHLFVQPNASAPPPLIRDDEIARLGGAVEYRSGDRLVVSLPVAAVEAVRRHGSVKYLQRTVKGPQPVVTPIGTTAPSPPASALRPAAHALRPSAHATWESGTYLYDGVGNITNIGGNVYVYDPLSRLARANLGTNTEIYTYDRFGNLTQRETNGTAFPVIINPNNNRLDGATYDPAGNLTAIGVQTYAYDPFSMMRQRGTAPDPDLYVYTASDERIGVRGGNYWLWSFRNASGKVIRQYESIHGAHMVPWRWVEDYVYRDGLLLGGERVPEEGGRRHFHLDHLGTPRLITGASGLTVSQHDYFPFGNEITPLCQEDCRGFDREEPMKFTGHERDFTGGTQTENTNYLDYMHARSTNPGGGRFLSVDPKERRTATATPQEWNRYAYALNNPLKFVDPDGEETTLAVGLQTSRNPIGHVAIIINDRVYSYATNWSGRAQNLQDWGANAGVYLSAQAGQRQTQLMTLNVSPEQEQKLQQHLEANNPNAPTAPGYKHLTNNCATVCQNALVQTGTMPVMPVQGPGGLVMSTGPAVTPQDVVICTTQTGMVKKVQTVGTSPKTRWYETLWNAVRDTF